jgi:nucleotide-binding universal stress UspA family protein
MSRADRFVIVVGTDFSELADGTLDHALHQASLREGSMVHVVHVTPDVCVGPERAGHAMSADATVDLVRRRVCERMDRMPAHLDKRRIRRVEAHFRHGSPAEGIAQLAADVDADVILVGSHGVGATTPYLGSVAERISRLARCPVRVVHPMGHSAAAQAPAIEPACIRCLAVQRETRDAELWCARHARHPVRARRYAYASDGIHAAQTTVYESEPGGEASAAE